MIPFNSLKLAFLGGGSIAQSLIQGYLKHSKIPAENIFVNSRNPKTRKKISEKLKVQSLKDNEELLEKTGIIFLCVKAQDLSELMEQLQSHWDSRHTLLSLVAGIPFRQFKKWGFPSKRLVRFMPNTNVCVGQGVLPFCSLGNQDNLNSFVEQLLKPLGFVLPLKEEKLLSPVTVACASGSSFILEIMEYWLEWLMGEGFSNPEAKSLVIQTFLGTGEMAQQRRAKNFSDLQKEIVSKKGISEVGLKNIREMELERILRLSFEQALLRLKEMS